MISLKTNDPSLMPQYATKHSAGADIKSSVDLIIPAGTRARVPTGVWIDTVQWDKVPSGFIPEIQVRARSGLAFKQGIMLTNGVGTVDADYPEEIGVLLYNSGTSDFVIQKGDRIAQVTINLVARFDNAVSSSDSDRKSGFGSTGK
ncbi:MAG: dUTP diphosphatase [Proteobacteria bacterium]|nr:dUTP diphosphatase [Pseudomonadota bacterium]